MRDVRILGLATYPHSAAATRYRVLQYVPHLARHGIELDVRPFLSEKTFAGLYDRSRVVRTAGGIVAGLFRRLRDVVSLSSYDALFLQREAALIGPPVTEWLAHRRLPVVLDLDDSTYVRRESGVFGPIASALKPAGKTDQLIEWADHVVCGSPAIAAYVGARGKPTTLQPTLVDPQVFVPAERDSDASVVTIGWIGSHSTFAYLEPLLPVLRRLALSHRFRVRLVGAGAAARGLAELDAELVPWTLENEVRDLQSFDIGLYPIEDDQWGASKSGFKAIEYLTCGVPYVASPVGIVRELGVPGQTHFEARTAEEWEGALARLLTDAKLRKSMGARAREYALEHFSLERTAATLANVFSDVIARRK